VYYYIIPNQKITDEFQDMNINEEMIDASGGVIPPDSPLSLLSLKESDCYALVSRVDTHVTYTKDPTHVVYESIRWGSRMLKSHPLYWADKRKLLTRILRSANTALFTLYKEHTVQNAVDAMVGFRGHAQLWLAVVGKVRVWNYHGTLQRVFPGEGDTFNDPLGSHRYAFAPHIVSVPFESKGFTIVTVGSASRCLESVTTPFATMKEIESAFQSLESPGAYIIIPHKNEIV
jgi:hypothetical protein